MRKLLTIPLIAVVLLAVAVGASAQSEWKGSYFFTETGGKNAGGIAIVITHELDIYDGGEGQTLAGSILSNGYQTAAELVCSIKQQGTKLLVYFESYGENNTFEPYETGDLLFTLERKKVKGKDVVLTHWGKFNASIIANQKSGKVYFEKSVETKK